LGPAQLDSLLKYLQSQAAAVASASCVVGAGLVSALIISIYLLYDWHRLHERFRRGSQAWRTWGAAVEDSERALGAWVRGQLFLSGAVGVMSFIALVAIGVQFAPVLAVLAFLFEFVPYAGPFLSGAPAVLVALNQSSTDALLVIVSYVIIQQLESHLLVPLVMRRAVDLHPVIIIAALLAGFEILGLAGVVLAVPVAVVVRIAWSRFWHA
jgi:predicted PurR-regulated permease PerM